MPQPQNQNLELSVLQDHAARMYGTGMTNTQVAKALLEYLAPTTKGRPMEVRLAYARGKLRRWQRRQAFRDRIYKYAIDGVDMNIPGILQGVVKRAKRGRIDAARLALEVTGRHNPKGDAAAPSVVVHIDGIPRPGGTPIQADVTYEEDEVEEV